MSKEASVLFARRCWRLRISASIRHSGSESVCRGMQWDTCLMCILIYVLMCVLICVIMCVLICVLKRVLICVLMCVLICVPMCVLICVVAVVGCSSCSLVQLSAPSLMRMFVGTGGVGCRVGCVCACLDSLSHVYASKIAEVCFTKYKCRGVFDF